MHLVLW